MLKEYAKLIALAKAHIDKGFSKVGRTLDAKDPVHRVLTGLASRAIALANCVNHLCLQAQPNEALPLLRSLAEISVALSWIVEKDSAARAADFLEAHQAPDWQGVWPSERLMDRARVLGFQGGLCEFVLSSCKDHVWGNAAGVPWGHVFEENSRAGAPAEMVLEKTALLMGHVVKALDKQWGQFAGASELWQAAESLRGKQQ